MSNGGNPRPTTVNLTLNALQELETALAHFLYEKAKALCPNKTGDGREVCSLTIDGAKVIGKRETRIEYDPPGTIDPRKIRTITDVGQEFKVCVIFRITCTCCDSTQLDQNYTEDFFVALNPRTPADLTRVPPPDRADVMRIFPESEGIEVPYEEERWLDVTNLDQVNVPRHEAACKSRTERSKRDDDR